MQLCNIRIYHIKVYFAVESIKKLSSNPDIQLKQLQQTSVNSAILLVTLKHTLLSYFTLYTIYGHNKETIC